MIMDTQDTHTHKHTELFADPTLVRGVGARRAECPSYQIWPELVFSKRMPTRWEELFDSARWQGVPNTKLGGKIGATAFSLDTPPQKELRVCM